MRYRKAILEEIGMERTNQISKFGDKRPYGNLHWLSVLAEEFGEVAADVTKREVPPEANRDLELQAKIRAELVQVAAVSLAWIEAIDNEDIIEESTS